MPGHPRVDSDDGDDGDDDDGDGDYDDDDADGGNWFFCTGPNLCPSDGYHSDLTAAPPQRCKSNQCPSAAKVVIKFGDSVHTVTFIIIVPIRCLLPYNRGCMGAGALPGRFHLDSGGNDCGDGLLQVD